MTVITGVVPCMFPSLSGAKPVFSVSAQSFCGEDTRVHPCFCRDNRTWRTLRRSDRQNAPKRDFPATDHSEIVMR